MQQQLHTHMLVQMLLVGNVVLGGGNGMCWYSTLVHYTRRWIWGDQTRRVVGRRPRSPACT